jgi:hypothetical protein
VEHDVRPETGECPQYARAVSDVELHELDAGSEGLTEVRTLAGAQVVHHENG